MRIIRSSISPEIKLVTIDIDPNSLVGEVNRFGVKLVAKTSGYEQWIIDAKTGKPARRKGYNCLEANGLYLWVKEGEVLRALDGLPFPSVWP